MPSIGNIWAQPEVGEEGEERRAKEIYGGQSPWSRVACLVHAVYGIHILNDHCYHLARTYYVPGPVLSISQTLSLLTFSAMPQVQQGQQIKDMASPDSRAGEIYSLLLLMEGAAKCHCRCMDKGRDNACNQFAAVSVV